MKVASLYVFVVKNDSLGRTVMVDTSFCSKMVRKIELVCVDLLLY